MRIAVWGAGRMGSALALYLAKAGHQVTVLARGERLATLRAAGAIETVSGERVAVTVAETLDPTTPFDGVIVTVLAHQVPPLLPALRASAAKSVVFIFNTVGSLQPLRDAVGKERAVFGFSSGFALLLDGKLRASFNGPGQEVCVSSPEWAEVLRSAKLPARVEPDMESFLRTHAAMVIPLMLSGLVKFQRGGVTWAESRRYARVMKEGSGIVRRLGNSLTPSSMAFMLKLPTAFATLVVFLMNKTEIQREFGSFGPSEVRELIDGMQSLAPGQAPEMLALRP